MSAAIHLAERIVQRLGTTRIRLGRESDVQATIAAVLAAEGIAAAREVRLAPGDVVDFLAGGVALEVKAERVRRRQVLRQCERYCRHDAVEALVLVTATAMGFPPEINGRPCFVVSLGRSWL